MAERRTDYRVCMLCEAICGLAVEHEDGRIVSIRGDDRDPLSRGHICPKGVALMDVQHDPDRLRTPVRRDGDRWVKVPWDEALDEITTRLVAMQREHGNHAVGFYYGNPTGHSCVAGEYCAGVNCLMGCEANNNCSVGQLCDLSNPTMGFNNKPVGTCRVPAACGGGTGGSTSAGGASGGGCFVGGNPACAQCSESACGTQLTACFGAGVSGGAFSGPCAGFGQCASACGCTQNCLAGCQAQLTGSCQSCLQTADQCLSSSCAAQCGTTSGGGGTSSSGQGGGAGSGGMPKSCTDLVSCCQKIQDPGQQMACASAASSGIDQLCTMELTMYKAQNLCP